jgi:transcriptional enhancer factor
MAGPDDDKKQSRGRESSYAHSLANTRERHHPQRTAAASSHDYNSATAHLWAGSDLLPSSYGRSAGGYGSDTSMSPYAVTDFTMFVSVDEQPVHFFTQIAPQPRQDDLIVTDRNSWHRQFPEFEFLRTQVDDWSTRGRKILVCDASIKVMTEWRPNANLSISFDLHSQRDLEDFKSIQSTTRFFDNGDMAPDPQFDGEDAHDLKEHRTFCEYIPGPQSCLMIKLGSKFWVNRMMKYQNLRHRNEGCVGISLRRLTATQDVYGIKHGKSGEAECLLTILWRFTQTRSSAEVGRMTWRSVSFDNRQPASVEQVWAEDKAHNSVKLEEAWNGSHEDVLSSLNNISEEASQFQVSHPLDFGHQHHAYDLQASHSQHPPQLHLDILASLQPGLEQPHASAAPSASTDYSQHSLSHVPHGHDAVGIYAHDPNDFNFDGGHINISGAFEPDINLSAYDAFAAHSTGLDGLHGLDHDGYSLGLACADGNELVNVGGAHLQDHPDLAYYSTKPNWQHANLISQLESAAENLQYHAYLDHDQTTHGHDSLQTLHTLAGPSPALTQGEVHGLHDAHINVNSGLWNLASPFHDDAEGGASDGVGVACRKDSAVLGHDEHAVGLGLLDLIERDQRARGY